MLIFPYKDMFQRELQDKESKCYYKRFVACIYRLTALKRTLSFSILQFLLPKRIKFILENSNCIIENLPFDCEFSTKKEVVDSVLYHSIQIT